MIRSRIDLIRNRLHGHNLKTIHYHLTHHRREPIRAMSPVRDVDQKVRPYMPDDGLRTAYVAFLTKSLDDDPHVPRLVKWLLRRIYHRYGWTAMDHDGKCYCKWEFLGIFDSATGARWAAMVPGGSWMELPLNESLPEETSQFRAHDFPRSSVSHEYRNRKLPFTTVPTRELERLDQARHMTDHIVEEFRSRSA